MKTTNDTTTATTTLRPGDPIVLRTARDQSHYTQRRIVRALRGGTVVLTTPYDGFGEWDASDWQLVPELVEQRAAAIARAREDSRNGYVQHVQRLDSGAYSVSDWYDSDTTVVSFANGKQL